MTRTLSAPPVAAACVAWLAITGQLAAQSHPHQHAASTDSVSAPALASPHIMVTPTRAPAPGDSARADSLVAVLRRSLAKYRDVRVAEADGFRQFAPRVKRQRTLHFTDHRAALRSLFSFDPARPTSLLYQPRADGTLELVGAMYTAPRWATLDELDARVPLAIAPWHQHVNLCVPPPWARERWLETHDGRPVFGPASPIATRAACEQVGGRFRERALGWMVHVDAFAGDDPAVIWGDAHRHDATAGSFPAPRGSSPMP